MLLWLALVAGSLLSLVSSVDVDHPEVQHPVVHRPSTARNRNGTAAPTAWLPSIPPYVEDAIDSEAPAVAVGAGCRTLHTPKDSTEHGGKYAYTKNSYTQNDPAVSSSPSGTATPVQPVQNAYSGLWSANTSTTIGGRPCSSPWRSSTGISGAPSASQNANITQHTNSTVEPKCGGCTISPVGATLGWWYPTSLFYGFTSLTTASNDESAGYEVVPASTSFDLGEAIRQEIWLMSTTFDIAYNTTGVHFVATTLKAPLAAATSEVYVTAVRPLPSGQIVSPSQIADAYIGPLPMASVSFTGAANKTSFGIASGTPYLAIPAYAVLTASKATDGRCRHRSVGYNLSEPYYGVYVGSSDPFNQTSVTESSLPPEFLSLVPETHARCDFLLVAEVEMLVIVTLIYDTGFSPFFAHVESTVTKPTDTALPTENVLTTATILTSGEAVVVVCGRIRCFPVIAIAHQESTAIGPLDGPGAVTRVIEPITTSTGKKGEAVTIFGQVPGSDGNGDDTGGSGGSSTSGGTSGGSSGEDGGSFTSGDSHPEPDSGGTPEGSGGAGHPGMVPLVAHVEFTLPVTFFVPASREITKATVSFQGQTLVATVEPTDSPNPTAAGSVAVEGDGSSKTSPTPTEGGHATGQDTTGSQSKPGNGDPGKPGGSGEEGTPGEGNVPESPRPSRPSKSDGIGFAETGETSGFTPSEADGGDAGSEPVQSTDDRTTGIQVLTIGAETFTADSQGQFSFNDGTTLSPGGSIDFHGTRVALAQGGSIAVVNGVTQMLHFAEATPPPILTIGTQTFVGNAATEYYLDQGATLTPGGSAAFDGSSISLDASAKNIVINGKTTPINAPRITPPPILLIDGTSITANAGSTYYVAGQRLTPGGLIKVSGTVISLASDVNYIVVDGSTVTRPMNSEPSYPVLTVGETAANPQPAPGLPGISEYIINGETLLPGGSALTVSDTTLSLLPSGAGLVVNGITSTFASSGRVVTSAPLLTIDGRTYSALAGGTSYLIDGQTLTPGGIVTVHGETVSLASPATVLVIDGKTVTLFPATGTATLTSTARIPAVQARSSQSASITSSASSDHGLQNAASGLRPMYKIMSGAALAVVLACWLT